MDSFKPGERLFKYPPMERQDLNQSQLGSFKFTPVDPVSNVQSLTQSAQRFLQQQLLQKQRLAGVHVSSVGPFQDNINTFSSPHHMPHAPDADFFNTHIKPDLGDSRLRLGPAVFRSAVDGSSPVKKPSFVQIQQESVYPERSLRSSMSTDPPHGAIRPQSLDFGSSLSTFLSPVDLPDLNQGHTDSASLVETLCMALANEQRAHHATKAAFTQHVAETAELLDQMKKSKQQIASLNITIKSLGAIIKHNVSRQSSEEDKSLHQTEYSEDTEEAALKEFYREYNKQKKSAAGRGVHTVNKEAHPSDPRQTNGLAGKDAAGEVVTAAAGKTIDDAELYNLDLLHKPDTDDSEDSAWRRTLRQHFFIGSSEEDSKIPFTPSKARCGLNTLALIDISPESIDGDNDRKDLPPKPLTLNGGLTDTQIRLLKAKDRSVTSSEEVVAKYGHKLISRAPQILRKLSNGRRPNLTMEHLAKLDGLHITGDGAVKPAHGNLTPISSAFDEDGQSTTAVVSSLAQPKSRTTVKIGDNLEGEPKWIINKDNPIYEEDGDKWRSIEASDPGFRDNSRFFDHPVRYLPEDAAVIPNSYRTVMVDGIPLASNILNVLGIIKGGPLESIQLFPPVGKSTSFMTARLVFIHERSAHNMIQTQEAMASQDSEANRFKIQGVAVRCWMPTDPTYPRNADLENELHSNSRASRIILIHGVDEYLYNQIPYKLRAIKPGCEKHVLEYSYADDDFIFIEFSDIKTAVKAFNALQMDPELWNSHFEYEQDYTCVSYAERPAVVG